MSGIGPFGSQMSGRPGPYPSGQGSPAPYPQSPDTSVSGLHGPYGTGTPTSLPPSPPVRNQYETHLAGTAPQLPPWSHGDGAQTASWAAVSQQPSRGTPPAAPPPKRRSNAKLIGIVTLTVALLAGTGVAAGIFLYRASNGPVGISTPAVTPRLNPGGGEEGTPSRRSVSPRPSSDRQVQVFQDLVVEWPQGWNVHSHNPDKGEVSFHYGKGQVWVYIYVYGNKPPWDAAHKCGNALTNWSQNPTKYSVSNVTVTQQPTKVDAPAGFNAAICGANAIYGQNNPHLRHFTWQGVYRESDGLNMWVWTEIVDGASVPTADIDFFRQQAMKAITTAS